MKNDTKTTLGKNEIIFEINTKIYPKEVIYKTCYVFIDKAFVYLDIIKKDLIEVSLKGKENLNKKQLENIRGEFFNELLNSLLREKVSQKNQKIVEYIVGGAITASLPKKEEKKEDFDLDQEIEKLKKELESIEDGDFENDSLDIKKIAKISRKIKIKKSKNRK